MDPLLYETHKKPPTMAEQLDGLDLFSPERQERERVLAQHEERHAAMLTVLRTHARAIYDRERRPVSVNDIRHILSESGFEGDRRVLGQVFAGKNWKRVGAVPTSCEGATEARVGVGRSLVGAYIPVEDGQQ